MNSLCVSGELRGLVGKVSITSEFWEAERYHLCSAADLSSKRDLRGQDLGDTALFPTMVEHQQSWR